jgi:hypothetical protein
LCDRSVDAIEDGFAAASDPMITPRRCSSFTIRELGERSAHRADRLSRYGEDPLRR